MKTARGTWHLSEDDGTGTGGLRLLCGPKKHAGHMHGSREAFEGLPKRARCEACDAALSAYKAKLLAEVEELERRQPPAVVVKRARVA